jgi:hypothetical protein
LFRLISWPPTHIWVLGSSPKDRCLPLTTNPPATVPVLAMTAATAWSDQVPAPSSRLPAAAPTEGCALIP